MICRATARGHRYYFNESARRRIPLGASLAEALRQYDTMLGATPSAPRFETRRRSALEILALAQPAFVAPCVYFLVRAGKIVYVGQAIDLHRRLGQHRTEGKNFDSFVSLWCAREQMDEIESYYIGALKPRWNVRGCELRSQLPPSQSRRIKAL